MIQSTATFWDDLLELIEAQHVVPIIGSELLRIPHNGGDASIYQLLAANLAGETSLPASELGTDDELHRVISLQLEKGRRKEDIHQSIREFINKSAFPIPETLKKLAQIRQFKLFVTTTFDTLLEQAINEVRYGGESRTETIAYAPNNVGDLPGEIKSFESTVVFHLLGRVSVVPEYVITEEDTLEYLHAMQTEKGKPELLLGELKKKSLLLIGNSFPDWLARFFIRVAKGDRLSVERAPLEIVADATSRHDKNLVLFLKNFSHRTRIYAEGGAVDFVDELVSRYLQRQRPKAKAAPEAALEITDDDMPDRAVFISYASQDLPAAKNIRDALEAANLTVWFDQARLEGGDDYDRKIRRNIKNCSIFVPLISTNTRARAEGYFRLEWNLAVERFRQFHDSQAFILPVVIDDTPNTEEALVPDRFLDIQWTRLPEGKPTQQLIERLVSLVRARRKREKESS